MKKNQFFFCLVCSRYHSAIELRGIDLSVFIHTLVKTNTVYTCVLYVATGYEARLTEQRRAVPFLRRVLSDLWDAEAGRVRDRYSPV